jgi:predicted nucleic acid-binding protein
MADSLLDTSILIRYLRRMPGYRDLLQQMDRSGELHISAITRLEILRGMRERERADTFLLFDGLHTISIISAIADLAGELIRTWRERGAAIGDADAIIAATAIHHKLTLVTTNARHFPMPELAVLQADEEGRLTQVAK